MNILATLLAVAFNFTIGARNVITNDFGGECEGGYPCFEIKAMNPAARGATLRLSYSCVPGGIRPNGDFTRTTAARYLGDEVDLPILPANIDRFDLFKLDSPRTYRAELLQGLVRYLRVELEGPTNAVVQIENLRLINDRVHSENELAGAFDCSDARLTRLWRASQRTCELAAIPSYLPAYPNFIPTISNSTLNLQLPKSQQELNHLCPTSNLQPSTSSSPNSPSSSLAPFVESAATIAPFALKSQQELNHLCPTSNLQPPTSSSPTLPYLSDGAKRDRLVWSGDLWWAQRSYSYCFQPSAPYMKGSIEMLAANQTPDGYVQASPWPDQPPPAAGDWGPFGSDEFACWFVPVAWDYFLHTGDRDTLEKTILPCTIRLMDYLSRYQRADGIFEQRKETCKHAAGLAFGDTSLHHRAFMNILLWKTYTDAAALMIAGGKNADSYQTAANLLATSIRKTFWSADHGYFRLSIEEDKFGFEANALALATKFVTPAEATRIKDHFQYHHHGKFQQLAIRGCFEYGFAEKAMELLANHNWYAILKEDWQGPVLCSECMGLMQRGDWGDECHPDTTLAGIFINYILGVIPTQPGFADFVLAPQPHSGITWAKGIVPTPRGNLAVEWHLENGKVISSSHFLP